MYFMNSTVPPGFHNCFVIKTILASKTQTVEASSNKKYCHLQVQVRIN